MARHARPSVDESDVTLQAEPTWTQWTEHYRIDEYDQADPTMQHSTINGRVVITERETGLQRTIDPQDWGWRFRDAWSELYPEERKVSRTEAAAIADLAAFLLFTEGERP